MVENISPSNNSNTRNKRWRDRVWFGRINPSSGKEEEVSWNDLTLRNKTDLLKMLILMGYILPTSIINFYGAVKQWQNHLASPEAASQESAPLPGIRLVREGRRISLEEEHQDGTRRIIILPPEFDEIMRSTDPNRGNWETTIHDEPTPAVSESPVYRMPDDTKE